MSDSRTPRSLINCQGFKIHFEAIPQIDSAAFSGSNTAWLVRHDGALMFTDDAGTTWRTVSRDAVDGFTAISFIDSQVGWTVNRKGQVWRTSDGGRTWSPISIVGTPESPFTGAVQITFLNGSEGWIIETFTVWHTRNGGANWERSLPAPHATEGKNTLVWASQPTRGFFLDAKAAWIAGAKGEVYCTEDGGQNWGVSQAASGDTNLRDIFFIDRNTGWAVGSPNGASYRTDDGGKRWRKQSMDILEAPGMHGIHFINRLDGWAVGQIWRNEVGRGTVGILLRTTDGGESWQRVELAAAEPFFDRIYFTDPLHGWLFARDNVYRTDDGGQSWRAVLRLPAIKKAP